MKLEKTSPKIEALIAASENLFEKQKPILEKAFADKIALKDVYVEGIMKPKLVRYLGGDINKHFTTPVQITMTDYQLCFFVGEKHYEDFSITRDIPWRRREEENPVPDYKFSFSNNTIILNGDFTSREGLVLEYALAVYKMQEEFISEWEQYLIEEKALMEESKNLGRQIKQLEDIIISEKSKLFSTQVENFLMNGEHMVADVYTAFKREYDYEVHKDVCQVFEGTQKTFAVSYAQGRYQKVYNIQGFTLKPVNKAGKTFEATLEYKNEAGEIRTVNYTLRRDYAVQMVEEFLNWNLTGAATETANSVEKYNTWLTEQNKIANA